MKVNTVGALLLAGLLAACGGAGEDPGGMMEDGSDMMGDESGMVDNPGQMGSDMMEPGMEEESAMDDAMDEGSMARDTSQMQRP